MIMLEHSVRMEVLQEHGYIVYLENMNDNSPMTNLGKLMVETRYSFHSRPHHCSCRNQSVIDEHVNQILTCKQFNGSIKSRHDLIVREIKSPCRPSMDRLLYWTAQNS